MITADESDVVYYTVRDGEKVGVCQTYAYLYSSSGLSYSDSRLTESELLNLSTRINLIESGINKNTSGSDLSSISNDISRHYYSYVNSLTDGDLSSAQKAGDWLLSSLVEYSVGVGGQTSSSVIKELEAGRSELLASLGTPTALTSEEGFNFMYSSDGYESIFGTDKLDGLTPAGLEQLAKSAPGKSSDRVIGRRIYSPKWYIAIPVGEATYLGFSEGAVYDVTFSDSDGATVDMKLERICVDEQDENKAYMLFSSYDLTVAASLSRTQSVSIYLGSCSGYRIPKQAIHHSEQYDYVYILVGNMVELRRVSIKGEGNGYYIVGTYQEDQKDNVSRDIPYLNTNDLLITSGNDLYDGKLLN